MKQLEINHRNIGSHMLGEYCCSFGEKQRSRLNIYVGILPAIARILFQTQMFVRSKLSLINIVNVLDFVTLHNFD
jgi:hypothetical protein